MDAMQLLEAPLPPARREKQDHLSENTVFPLVVAIEGDCKTSHGDTVVHVRLYFLRHAERIVIESAYVSAFIPLGTV